MFVVFLPFAEEDPRCSIVVFLSEPETKPSNLPWQTYVWISSWFTGKAKYLLASD